MSVINKLKTRWETLPGKLKQLFIISGLMIAVIFVIVVMAKGEAEKQKDISARDSEQMVGMDIFGNSGSEKDIEVLSASVNSAKQSMIEMEKEISKYKNEVRDLQIKISQYEAVNGDPEIITTIAQKIDELQKQQKEFEAYAKERIGVVNASPSKENANEATSNIDVESMPTNLGESPFSDVDLFSETQTNSKSSSKIDLIGGESNSVKVERADAREALIKQAEKGPSVVDTYTEEAAPEKSFGIFISEPEANDTASDSESNVRSAQSSKGNTTRDLRVAAANKDESKEFYINAGSMFKAFLITGIDAPTGDVAKSHPVPVTLRVSTQALLPNRFQFDIRDCFVIGAAYGEISSERVHIRTELLSCAWGETDRIEVPLDGFATGEDGKVGLRGTLVSKQGKMLYNAALSGALGGFGESMKPQQINSLRTGAQGGEIEYDAPPIDAVIGNGVQGGIANSAKKIADFYLEKADAMHPIIEIDAMREITIQLKRGARIKVTDLAKAGTLSTKKGR